MSDTDQSDRVPTQDEMEELFVNNPYLEKIDAYLNRFNPIRIMRMERMEIRHSAILAWLLDPKETHDLDDRFLKAFLGEALRGQSGKGEPTALDIFRSDLRDAEVRREWQGIDILVLCSVRGRRCAFIIENKIDSKQSDGQLEKYTKKVTTAFKEGNKTILNRGIFLTLWDEEPQDPDYVPINYDAIRQILSHILLDLVDPESSEVAAFLGHYLDVLQEATGMSEEQAEMERIARELYRENRKVIDFVIQHGTGSDFKNSIQGFFATEPKWLQIVSIGNSKVSFNELRNNIFSFIPECWFIAFGGDGYDWPGCENWWAGYPLICWLQLSTNQEGVGGEIRLYAEVGPVRDHEFRRSLIEDISKLEGEGVSERISFRSNAANEGTKYSKFLKNNSISITDIHDAEEVRAKAQSLLESFQPVFEAVAGVLDNREQYRIDAQ